MQLRGYGHGRAGAGPSYCPPDMTTIDDDTLRLDRWLHAARWFKTRSLAAEAIEQGRVLVNGARAKPSKTIRRGDHLDVRRPPYTYAITVRELSAKRVSATLAQTLFEESAESIAAREALGATLALQRVVEERRPGKLNKKDRRARERLKRGFAGGSDTNEGTW
ncbi:MAG: RNA-binding S4 domain-containing protein [Gammaproteobacteria bacterium]